MRCDICCRRFGFLVDGLLGWWALLLLILQTFLLLLIPVCPLAACHSIRIIVNLLRFFLLFLFFRFEGRIVGDGVVVVGVGDYLWLWGVLGGAAASADELVEAVEVQFYIINPVTLRLLPSCRCRFLSLLFCFLRISLWRGSLVCVVGTVLVAGLPRLLLLCLRAATTLHQTQTFLIRQRPPILNKWEDAEALYLFICRRIQLAKMLNFGR